MWHALGAIVNRRLQHVEISQPDGLLLIRARGIEIFDQNPILAELVIEPAVAEEGKRVLRTPDLLATLLRAKDPIIASLDRAEAINEIACGKAAETAVPVLVQEVRAHSAEFIHLHRISRCPRVPLGQSGTAANFLAHHAPLNLA